MSDQALQPLSLLGGPTHRLERRLHVEPLARSIAASVALTWGVAIVLVLVDSVLRGGDSVRPVLTQAGGHARLLLGIPLLLVAERTIAQRVASATRRLLAEELIAPASVGRWRRVTERVEAWRGSRLPELVLAVVVVAATAAGVGGVLPDGVLRWLAPTLHESVRAVAPRSLALWWFIVVAQPIFLFLVLRFLWSWSLWSFALGRLSRMELRLQATHPDRAGGVGFLQDVLDSFMIFTLCIATTFSATWVDEIRATGVAAASFAPTFLTHIVFALVVGVAPYWGLGPLLFRAKRAGSAQFAALGRRYIDAFERRWFGQPERRPSLLGTADLQSLADLGTAFSVIDEMRVNVVSPRKIARLTAFAVAPLVPLLLFEMPANEIARKLIELVA